MCTAASYSCSEAHLKRVSVISSMKIKHDIPQFDHFLDYMKMFLRHVCGQKTIFMVESPDPSVGSFDQAPPLRQVPQLFVRGTHDEEADVTV